MIDGISPGEKKPLRIGLLGCGVVGSAVARALASQPAALSHDIQLTHVALRDPTKDRDCDLAEVSISTDPQAVVEAPDVDVVVETIGGLDPAFGLVDRALELRKPTISANKALLGLKGRHLAERARLAQVPLRYEAAVAAAIPVVRTVEVLRQTDHIHSLHGVLNGTANYVVSRMESAGTTLAAALAEAQRLGYAEADASRDLDGSDAADKVAILTELAYGDGPARSEIPTCGIEWITPADIAQAAAAGRRWRLVASSVREGCARVEPQLVDADTPLGRLAGAHNGIIIEAERSGVLYLEGPGAGGEATAAAILADLRDIANLPRTRYASWAYRY